MSPQGKRVGATVLWALVGGGVAMVLGFALEWEIGWVILGAWVGVVLGAIVGQFW